MSHPELAALERDVEQARTRFANDLAQLLSPATFSEFKEVVVAEKDELVDKAKDSARETAQRVLNDLKDKAFANPAAALAIGAGLAWRIAHRPPVASLLVGLGLVSLLRTTSSKRAPPYMGLYDEDPAPRLKDDSITARTSELVESVKERVQDWSAEAGEAARETVTKLTDKAVSMADSASETARTTAAQISDRAASIADHASEMARTTATQISSTTASIKDGASTAVQEVLPDQEVRDKLLLGAAALAVAAAVGMAYQRRNQEERGLEPH